MYRVNAQSRALEEMFMRYGLPYRLVGGTRFYQRREIKDVVAYLRVIHNPQDNISLTRIINVPGRGIGSRTLAELKAWANARDVSLFTALGMIAEKKGPPLAARAIYALSSFHDTIHELISKSKELPVSSLLETVVEKSGYRDYILNDENGGDRWENIMELRTVARDFNLLDPEDALAAFLEKVSLVSDIDELDEKLKATTLTTLHQAKGLEFPVVFIVGVEEGLLPHRRSLEDPGELEEERRLCYVGVTRAKKLVYLVYTYHRSLFGASAGSDPSRFLKDIPQHLVTFKSLWEDAHDDVECTPVTALHSGSSNQYSSLSPARPSGTIHVSSGDRVRHSIFGDGVVINCSHAGDDQQVTIDFADVGVKRLLLSLAPLEKIK
jgi:DNA helicase-2/ATP-dependent DNA helicase PcrA